MSALYVERHLSKPVIKKTHMKIHSTEWSYICNICKKAFRFLTGLKTHIQTHYIETPYICSTCGKSFGRAGSVKVLPYVTTHLLITVDSGHTC